MLSTCSAALSCSARGMGRTGGRLNSLQPPRLCSRREKRRPNMCLRLIIRACCRGSHSGGKWFSRQRVIFWRENSSGCLESNQCRGRRPAAALAHKLFSYGGALRHHRRTTRSLNLSTTSQQAAQAFYSGLLGLPVRAKPAELAQRGGCWFEAPGVKVHLGVEANFRAAKKAHPALLVDDLAALLANLESESIISAHIRSDGYNLSIRWA